jgi:pimeloyl-ACP methyl ester carboxylesterase
VIVPDLRGHGASAGLCTLGESEVLDVAAAVAAAPPGLPVVTVGISLGGAVALLLAGTTGRSTPGFAGVVAVSAPAWWGAWDTAATARIRRYATSAAGRAFMARVLNTRLAARCAGVPDSHSVVASIAPAFTLVVHDPADHYFGEEHAQTLYRWAREPRDLWLLPGTGHGTDLLTPTLADRLMAYVGRCTTRTEPVTPMEDVNADG